MDLIQDVNQLAQVPFVQNNKAIGIALLSNELSFIYANAYLTSIFVEPTHDITQCNLLLLVNKSQEKTVRSLFDDLITQKTDSLNIDIQLQTRNNNQIWFAITATIDSSNNTLLLFINNCEERKKAEVQLQKAEADFRSIAENSSDLIMRYDLNYRHIYTNPASLKLLEITESQLLGKTHEESGLFEPEICKLWKANLKQVIDSKTPLQTQFIWTKNAQDYIIDWAITPEFDNNGNLISLLGISRDITTKQSIESELNFKCNELAEKNEKISALNEEFASTNEELSESYSQISSLYNELEESEEKYRNAFFTSPDSITITTVEGIYIDVNKGFTAISEYKYEEVINKSSSDINIWENKEDRIRFIQELQEKGNVLNFECQFHTKSGKIKTTLLSSCFIKIKGVKHILLIARDVTEWKKTQLENNQFVEIVSTIQTAIYVYHLEDINDDKSLKLINLNAASLLSLGLSKDLIINKYIDDAFPKLREQNIPEIFKTVINTGTPYSCSSFSYSDDNVKESFSSFKVIPLANNHLCVLVENITPQKKAEKAYSESENKYKEIFNSTNEAIFISDVDTNEIIEINEAVVKVYGYQDKEEILAINRNELNANLAPYTEAKSQEWLNKTLTQGPQVYEWLAKKKNGTPFWVEISLRKTNLGEKERIIAVIRDINKRKQAEEALRDSEQRFNMAFRNSPISVVITTFRAGIYIDANNTFLRDMGYSRNEIIGKSINDISIYVYNSDREKLLDKLKSEGIVYGEECLFITKNGAILTCLISIGVISIQGEWCLLSTIIDISSRKLIEQDLIKAKDKAEESDRLKSAFLANMSHEIRTPMNAIKGFAQLLERTDMQEAKKYKFTQIISQRTDDLLTLINDLLDIAKIEAGQLTLVEQRDNINNLFNEIFQFFKAQQAVSEPKPVKLSFKNKLTLTENYICTDFFRLRQILINLINNALKFTEEGTVEFGCEISTNGNLLFFVKDSGMGIPDDKHNLIFEPFRQINDAYLSKKKGGTGLGLSIVKGLVELMKGEVWFESQYGIGTTFFFTLPFIQTPAFKQKNEIQLDREYSWTNKKILVVEDDEANTLLINELLSNTKSTNYFAISAKEALSKLYENPDIDLVLMDIQLPDINGYELTTQLKSINPNIIIIAQTAYAAEADKARALAVGCSGFIAKPIDQYKLLIMIQMCFDGDLAEINN